MAYSTVNGFSVDKASSLIVIENLMQPIQHINGKGCTDTYTPSSAVERVMSIDVMRILPKSPMFRQLGATANGAFHNKNNEGGFKNAPQSVSYSVPVDLFYDYGVPITDVQTMTNKVEFKSVVTKGISDTIAMVINIVTYAKQIEAFFKDSFDCSRTPGTDVTDSKITAAEKANALFYGDTSLDANKKGSYANAWLRANSKLTDGIPEIGAFYVPMEEREGFITGDFEVEIKGQYMQNASDKAVEILSNGYINPFNNKAGQRIDSRTGYVGQYDGVDMVRYYSVTKKFVEYALNASSEVIALLDRVKAFIVYGGATLRGIVGPQIEANPNTYFGGVYILPKLKLGVKVLTGKSIKMILDKGTAELTDKEIATIANGLTFTPIDGQTRTASSLFDAGVFDPGTGA